MASRPMRAALVIILVGVAACGDVTAVDRRIGMLRSFWEGQRPASYRITVSRSCECMSETSAPAVVEVTNGVVTSRHYVHTGEPVPPQYAGSFPTIDGLFEIIEAARRDRVARLDVTYDPTYGYPSRISIDHVANMVDDEVVISARGFEPREE